MKSEGERHECPFEPCGAFHLLLPNGLLPVHTVRGKPCPGGGYDTRGPKKREDAKLKARIHASGNSW